MIEVLKCKLIEKIASLIMPVCNEYDRSALNYIYCMDNIPCKLLGRHSTYHHDQVLIHKSINNAVISQVVLFLHTSPCSFLLHFEVDMYDKKY